MSTDNTYTIYCEVCERDVEHNTDTGEPSETEDCSTFECPIIGCCRDGGDPEELDFSV